MSSSSIVTMVITARFGRGLVSVAFDVVEQEPKDRSASRSSKSSPAEQVV